MSVFLFVFVSLVWKSSRYASDTPILPSDWSLVWALFSRWKWCSCKFGTFSSFIFLSLLFSSFKFLPSENSPEFAGSASASLGVRWAYFSILYQMLSRSIPNCSPPILSLPQEYLMCKSTVLQLAGWKGHWESQDKERKKETERRG